MTTMCWLPAPLPRVPLTMVPRPTPGRLCRSAHRELATIDTTASFLTDVYTSSARRRDRESPRRTPEVASLRETPAGGWRPGPTSRSGHTASSPVTARPGKC